MNHSRSAMLANTIVRRANSNQKILPRDSNQGLFRLPTVELMIANSHANVSGIQYKRSACVLPFILRGATETVEGINCNKLLFMLIKLCLDYLELHHYSRRINREPYFVYRKIEEALNALFTTFSTQYRATIGIAKSRKRILQRVKVKTIKSLKIHQLYKHIIEDIKAAGLLSNYDAQAVESHHILSRAHYKYTAKRVDDEHTVAIRSTVRETGVLFHMYQVPESALLSSTENIPDYWEPYRNITAEVGIHELGEGGKYHERDLISCLPTDLSATSFMDLCFVRDVARGNVSVMEDTSGHIALKLAIRNTIRIKAQYPWCKEQNTNNDLTELRSLSTLIHASSSFYDGEPWYDFVAYKTENRTNFGQVRLIFKNPYGDEEDFLLVLLRPLSVVCRPSPSSLEELEERESGPDINWREETANLFHNYGCPQLRWKLYMEEYVYKVVSVNAILHPLYIIRDFSHPPHMDKNDSMWKAHAQSDNTSDQGRVMNQIMLLPILAMTISKPFVSSDSKLHATGTTVSSEQRSDIRR